MASPLVHFENQAQRLVGAGAVRRPTEISSWRARKRWRAVMKQ